MFQIDQHVYSILEVPTNFDWPRIHAEFQITTKNRPFGFDNQVAKAVVCSLMVAALSATGAILLILEMYTPYGGLIEISSAPLRAALMQLGK